MMKSISKYSLFVLFLGMANNVSADSHNGGGFNTTIILLPPLVFLLVMLVFTYRTWYLPRQREKVEKQLLKEGLILKNSTLPDKRLKAVANLESLAENLDNSTPYIPLLAKLSMLEFSLLRIKEQGDLIQINTIKEELADILSIAQKHLLNRLIVEMYILQAKVALIEGTVDKVERLLTKAELLAEQKGFSDLIEQIEDERTSYVNDEFLQNVKDMSPLDRATQVNLDDQLFVAIQELKERYQGLPVDTPVWLMMMTSTGVTLYSQKFLAGLYIDDQLFGGFITAINKFSKEVFGDGGDVNFKTVSSSIDYIKYGEFNLILKPVDQFLFCYVIKGKTENAKNRLEAITFEIKSNDLVWTEFKNFEDSQSIDLEIDNMITTIIENQLFPEQS